MNTWELEDYLQDEGVYTNGLYGGFSHMDSYMTITNYDKLIPALIKIKDKFTLVEWGEMAEEFIYQGYISPNSFLLGKQIQHTILGK
jgi:hypothetical protein